jgi:hypothetical protein
LVCCTQQGCAAFFNKAMSEVAGSNACDYHTIGGSARRLCHQPKSGQ